MSKIGYSSNKNMGRVNFTNMRIILLNWLILQLIILVFFFPLRADLNHKNLFDNDSKKHF